MHGFASTEGSAAIRTDARRFVEAFVRRIEAGLLDGRPHRRSRYLVTRTGADRVEFRAADWPTAINVGLNEVEVAVTSPGRVRYQIRYPRWAGYAVGLCGLLGVGLIVAFLVFDIRGYLARQPGSAFLSSDQQVAMAWSMALFWGFAWPWILIALHRRPLRRLMERLIADIDAAAALANTAATE
jgi:hypothetical protein